MKVLKQLSRQKYRGSSGWLLALTVAIALLIWNWKLLIATSAGVVVMLLVYLMQEWDWQAVGSQLRRWLHGSNRQMAIAVCTGGLTTFSTYMAVSIWLAAENPWLATGAILQGVATMATLILVVWQLMNSKTHQNEATLNDLSFHLADADPLKRLIAVRQMTRLMKGSDRSTCREIAEYFRVMLARETDGAVRDALLDGMQGVQPPQSLGVGAQPLSIPSLKKRSTPEIRRRMYECEE